MNSFYIFIYHAIYWIYRVLSIWAFTHVLYGENWYKGAYVVQLVLMPFFYTNYFLLIPLLINKKHKFFLIGSACWIFLFVWVYSNWTIYQRNILYGESILSPNYIETFNNVIYIWLISTCFCLFEFWVKNIRNNQNLTQDSQKHMLKTKENSMLNHLLSDYLNTLDEKKCEEMAEKIMLLSDFFKYVLYSQGRKVALDIETTYLKIFEELKNESQYCLTINYKYETADLFIQPSQLIYLVNRLTMDLVVDKPIDLTIERDELNRLLISFPSSYNTSQNQSLWNELSDFKIEVEESKSRIFLYVI